MRASLLCCFGMTTKGGVEFGDPLDVVVEVLADADRVAVGGRLALHPLVAVAGLEDGQFVVGAHLLHDPPELELDRPLGRHHDAFERLGVLGLSGGPLLGLEDPDRTGVAALCVGQYWDSPL